MGKMVIPKNTATVEEVMGAIQIYYDANDWLSNTDFIRIYKNRIGVIGDDNDFFLSEETCLPLAMKSLFLIAL